MEHKLLNTGKVEVKFKEDSLKFSGYASVFDGVDGYGDTIKAGAYTNTLKGRDREIKMRWNHYGQVIGKWINVQEDEKGLWVEGELTPNHSLANDVAASMKHGAIDGMSIGYIVKDYEQKGDIRQLNEIELVEISIVEEPADNAARVNELKSLSECKSLKDIEKTMRNSFGLSQTESTAIVSAVKNVVYGEREEQKTIDEQKARELIKNFKL